MNEVYETYQDFLNSSKWKEISNKVKARDNYKCVICGSDKNLRAHHTSYDDICNMKYIITLCDNCHNSIHKGIQTTSYKMHEVQDFLKFAIDDTLADITLDIYKNSILKSNSDINIRQPKEMEKLYKILIETFKNLNQKYLGGLNLDFFLDQRRSYFFSSSSDKIGDLQVQYTDYFLKKGMTPKQIKRKLKMTNNRYYSVKNYVKNKALYSQVTASRKEFIKKWDTVKSCFAQLK